MVEIEYCTDAEWLVVFGGYDQDLDTDSSEPGTQACEQLRREFNAVEAIDEVELVGARGVRCLCHGWNGARFTWRYGQFGTFEKMSEPLRKKIEAAIEAARLVVGD